MAREMQKFGMTLRHVIGPKMGHAYHPEAKREVNRRVDALANETSNIWRRWNELQSFSTYSLRYASNTGLLIYGMEDHWKKATVEVDHREWIRSGTSQSPVFRVITSNVNAFKLELDRNANWNSDITKQFLLNGEKFNLHIPSSDLTTTINLRKEKGKWKLVDTLDDGTLRKKPGLQGPIDDAFMESFLIVKPSGTSPHTKVSEWVDAEMNRAIDQWRKQFRGIPRVKFDKDVNEADINNHHLVLWGTPESNSVMKKLAEKLPVQWKGDKLTAHQKSYDASSTVPILIYPNPLNSSKYIVLNSGHTFREESNRSNARQTPKLPDWAIIDITTPPNSYHPGKVVDAGFFGEEWQWK